MDSAETEREAEFGLIKELLRKLVHALGEKADDEAHLVGKVNPAELTPHQESRNNKFRERKSSMPPPLTQRQAFTNTQVFTTDLAVLPVISPTNSQVAMI